MSTRLLVLRVGLERVGLPVAAVREIVDAPGIVPIPLAPSALAGQMWYREAFLPMLDPAVALGVSRDASGPGVAIVLADAPAGLLVDDVDDIWEQDAPEQALPAGLERRQVLRALRTRGSTVVAEVDVEALRALALASLRQEMTP